MFCQIYNRRKLCYQKCRPAQSLKYMLIRFFIETFKFTKNSYLSTDLFEMAKYTTNTKGNPQLVDMTGYEYTKIRHARSGIKIYWRCSKYKSLKCSAKAITEASHVVRSVGEKCRHNH